MQGYFTPQEFLSYLNEYLKVKTPDIVEEKSRDERSNGNVPLFTPDILDFEKDVDLVICGPCSGTLGVIDRKEYSDEFPMGKCVVAAGEPDKSWLHAVIARQEKPIKNVVVYATCCGDYSDRYKQMLRQLFPEITWHFPYVQDLCDNHNPDRIGEGLLKAGFLKIVPAAVVQ